VWEFDGKQAAVVERLENESCSSVISFSFSRNGKHLASSDENSRISIWCTQVRSAENFFGKII
jgi:WD40 repeat protein